MGKLVPAGFVFLGVLHLPPAVGAMSPDALTALYGPAAGDDSVRVLLQHRGAMFALVAIGCFAAAVAARWRPAMAVLAGWSMVGFLGFYFGAGAPSGPLRTIAVADGLGLAVLLSIAPALRWGCRPTWPSLPSDGVEVSEIQRVAIGEGDPAGTVR